MYKSNLAMSSCFLQNLVHKYFCDPIYYINFSFSLFSLSLSGYEFPFDFVSIVRRLFRQFFSILAHIYFHHYLEFKRLQLHDGLNTLFLHFIYFVSEFSLIDPKELSILEDLVERLKSHELALAQQPINDSESEFNMVASKSS